MVHGVIPKSLHVLKTESIQHKQLMAKICVLSTGNLSQGGMPRNSVDWITDRPDMTSAVYRGRKASTQ